MKSFATNGYKLTYDTWGKPGDRAVLFFHGFPGSHIQAEGMARHVRDQDLFLIAVDRPGYGGTRGPGDRGAYLDALRALLTHLNVPRFDVVGVSGGSPWAHIMASRFASDVRSLTIICGLGPLNQETEKFFTRFQKRGLRLRKFVPTIVAEMIVAKALAAIDPDEGFKRLTKILSAPDIASLGEPAHHDFLVTSMLQARQQQGKGIANDAALYHRDWLRMDCDETKLAEIPTYYFHGMQDKILNPAMTEWMHKRHKNSKVRFFEKEGHYSLPLCQAETILQAVHESHREKVS